MNLKMKIKAYMLQGKTQEEATEITIREAQKVINDMDEKLSQAITYLSESQIKEIYGDFIED